MIYIKIFILVIVWVAGLILLLVGLEEIFKLQGQVDMSGATGYMIVCGGYIVVSIIDRLIKLTKNGK